VYIRLYVYTIKYIYKIIYIYIKQKIKVDDKLINKKDCKNNGMDEIPELLCYYNYVINYVDNFEFNNNQNNLTKFVIKRFIM